jgi:hypothetical protein
VNTIIINDARPARGPVQIAEHATATIRHLIYQTRGPQAFTDPAELGQLLAELTTTVSCLPPLLNQLQYWLRHEHDTAHLEADTDTGLVVAEGVDALTHASRTARELTTTLDQAHQHVAQLATTSPETRHQTEERPTNHTKGVNFRP